ncbi:MAG: DUF262 domain-containing protein [Chloroflexi bacterium]|nr:DUF262 domain-containing protein [bacterium]MDE0674960.1 DUF262 domain-containing protein [bacterium]MYB76857.1 DUF262 domain-containing protein [Chloroflexota bacterium]
MKVEQRTVAVRHLTDGYSDDGDGGVVGYGRRLDIRPPFQREFVYKPAQRNAVIDTIWRNLPLNVMYWADREDGTYEVIDGQQRTVSICQYVTGKFSHLPTVGGHVRFFDNLTDTEQNKILDYPLTVYVCSGTAEERLEWFKIVNIAGEPLTDQELRNAVFPGPWLADAKRWFSRPGGAAEGMAGRYLRGSAIRQDYLQTALKWAAGKDIDGYMGAHQYEENAEGLWNSFRAVIDWVESTFTEYRPKMKGVDWGALYDAHRHKVLDPDWVEVETARLVADDDVTRQAGIYAYILTGDESHLNIRKFPNGVKQRVYEAQGGRCKVCDGNFPLARMEADHITPWSEGGRTEEPNCQVLCRDCNRRKGAR